MDYRRTEDFARSMEAAEFRARLLREQFIDDVFAAIGRGLRKGARALAARWRTKQNARAERARASCASSTGIHGSPPARG